MADPEIAFALLGASDEVEELARGYFDIRVWAAPASLATYALFGWLIGLGRTGLALVMAVVLNVTNIVLDVVLALQLGWGVQGVATGAMSAEVAAAAVGGVARVAAAPFARCDRPARALARWREAQTDVRDQFRHHDPHARVHRDLRVVHGDAARPSGMRRSPPMRC